MERALRLAWDEGATLTTTIDSERLQRALETAVAQLRAEMRPEGYWEGQLASSALATATALSAFAIAHSPEDMQRLIAGAEWLERTQNTDGGWGDTPESPSNLATTLLVISALRLASLGQEGVARAHPYLQQHGATGAAETVHVVRTMYGADRTFAVPILMNCALAGLVEWADIPGLPFEMAIFPHAWYKLLRLHVVSYALPALIAIGLLLAQQSPARNPILRVLRKSVVKIVLAKLAYIQPTHGGFLDATPLTAFVAMSLIAREGTISPIAEKCLGFLRASMRPDGSWSIDTDLSVWVTSSAFTALRQAEALHEEDAARIARWLCARQSRQAHPFTAAEPGGWGWTYHPGSVPDADDTSGALLALQHSDDPQMLQHGITWLLHLQNQDGGWPTFCKGWGQLPFDQSNPDITAHAMRALAMLKHLRPAVRRAIRRGLHFLSTNQQPNGAWIPLWFGNQYAAGKHNPVLGTARVLMAYAVMAPNDMAARRGISFLLHAQNADGGWGGDAGVQSSIEETALAVIALSELGHTPEISAALHAGICYLLTRVEDGRWRTPAPIGLYFSQLWYTEALYPMVWTVEALGRARRLLVKNLSERETEAGCRVSKE